MILFIVTKEGIYRHEIYGIFDEAGLAVRRALEVCRDERDDYHQFQIRQYEKNEPDDNDGVLYATVKRDKDVVSIVKNKQE